MCLLQPNVLVNCWMLERRDVLVSKRTKPNLCGCILLVHEDRSLTYMYMLASYIHVPIENCIELLKLSINTHHTLLGYRHFVLLPLLLSQIWILVCLVLLILCLLPIGFLLWDLQVRHFSLALYLLFAIFWEKSKWHFPELFGSNQHDILVGYVCYNRLAIPLL
jgi:hypothetical protein